MLFRSKLCLHKVEMSGCFFFFPHFGLFPTKHLDQAHPEERMSLLRDLKFGAAVNLVVPCHISKLKLLLPLMQSGGRGPSLAKVLLLALASF